MIDSICMCARNLMYHPKDSHAPISEVTKETTTPSLLLISLETGDTTLQHTFEKKKSLFSLVEEKIDTHVSSIRISSPAYVCVYIEAQSAQDSTDDMNKKHQDVQQFVSGDKEVWTPTIEKSVCVSWFFFFVFVFLKLLFCINKRNEMKCPSNEQNKQNKQITNVDLSRMHKREL
jgi:hypothetical protein